MTPRDSQRQALEAAIKELDRRIGANRSTLTKAQADQAQEVSRASGRISDVEYRARQKAQSYHPSVFSGCLIAIGIVVGGFWLLAYMVNSGSGASPARTRDLDFIGTALLVCFGILMVGLLWKPIMRYFRAELPASGIRAEVPRLRSEYERVKADSEARLSREKTRLDTEHEQLKRQKEECQSALKAL
jgi:hypothetical protein